MPLRYVSCASADMTARGCRLSATFPARSMRSRDAMVFVISACCSSKPPGPLVYSSAHSVAPVLVSISWTVVRMVVHPGQWLLQADNAHRVQSRLRLAFGLPFERCDGWERQDPHPLDLRQVRDQDIGQAVGKVFLRRIARKIT